MRIHNFAQSAVRTAFQTPPFEKHMETWSRLCCSEATEKTVLHRLERSGLSAHMKQIVGREIDNPDVHATDLERTAFASFVNSGCNIHSTVLAMFAGITSRHSNRHDGHERESNVCIVPSLLHEPIATPRDFPPNMGFRSSKSNEAIPGIFWLLQQT